MKQDRYSESSIHFYDSVYKEFCNYLLRNSYDEFADDVRDKFLLDIYGIRIYDFQHLPKHRQKCIRAMEIINIYAATAKIPVLLSYYKDTEKVIADVYLKSFDEYAGWMENEGFAAATVTQRKRRSSIFLEFLSAQGIRDFNTLVSFILLYTSLSAIQTVPLIYIY